VSVLATGVLGQTGMETAEIVNALIAKIKPNAVIVIDALACSDIKRLGTTIQLSDSGISPGSGVQNSRKELSSETLGIPVIAIGVPTVVDMHTIVQNLTGHAVSKQMPNMMVTSRDIDKLIERAAKLIANGINLALQPQMSYEDVESLA
jgi:spore protease